MTDPHAALDRLRGILGRRTELAVAVSGGVDSLTLAHVAAGVDGLSLTAIHALSPAVPAAATERVRRHAERGGWRLIETDAGEYDDPDYRSNPVNRCFFCKNNLYARIRGLTTGDIASGTNLDDLGDFRPGLNAARDHGVVHPFVEAEIDKATVRAIAAHLGLTDIAELPAQPCLASRVETGIAIEAADLAFIDRVETRLADLLGPGDIRCRVTASGVVVELPPMAGTGDQGERVDRLVSALCAEEARHYAGRRPYRRGSAFLTKDNTHARH